MKINTIYFSPTGTTEKIIQKVAASIGNDIQNYNLTLPQNRTKYQHLTFSKNDLLIVGVPVYSGRIPEFLENYLSRLKGNNTPAIFVVVYGNRDYDDALLELKTIFQQQGFLPIAAGALIGEHSFSEEIATNRPDTSDMEIVSQFGQDILAKLDKITDNEITELYIKGNRPYKARKPGTLMVPATDSNCNNCGICANNCPMAAIDFNNFRDIDAEKCIHCSSCIKKCPVNAKAFKHEVFDKILNFLHANCSSERKEPELFL